MPDASAGPVRQTGQMSDLRHDVEKKGERTMKLRRSFLLWGTVALAGCAHVDPNPAFRELANTVHLRTGKRAQWNRGSTEDAQAQSAVTSLLKRPLTADSAVQVALLNNHNLQATYEELGIAQAELVEAGLLKNPVFYFERRLPGQAAEIDLVQEFVDILLLPLRKRIAAAQFEAAKLRVGHEILTTAAEVRAAFYEHQGDQQLVDLRKTVADATERSAETALKMHEAGNLRDLDLASEQATHAQAKIDLAKAQANAVQSREKLNKLMGAFGAQTNWTVASRLSELPGNEVSTAQLESRAIQQRLDLAAARQQFIAAARDKMLLSRRQVEYFKSTALPTRTRVTEESQLEYNAMQIGPFQLLQAKQEEVKTGADSVEALRDYWIARAELEKAVGGSLSGKFIARQSESKEATH